MENQYTVENYVQYLHGTMDTNMAEQFAQDLSNSVEMQAMLQEQKELALTVQVAVLKNRLATVHENYEASLSTKQAAGRRINLYQFAIAASLLLMISAGLWVWIGSSKGDYDGIFQQYYRADNGLPSLMDGFATPINDAMIDYKEKKYAVAVTKFQGIVANDTATYYLAASYAGLEKYAEAVTTYGKIDQTSAYYERSLWYAALLSLKTNDQATAKRHLTVLRGIPNGKFVSQAEEILKELR